MRHQKCPKTESLLELISIAQEISLVQRVKLRWHLRTCSACTAKTRAISETWSGFMTPEPEVTSSLLKVYSQLQNDETLILKGWKLNLHRPRPRNRLLMSFQQSWLVRGGLMAAILTVVSLVFWTRGRGLDEGKALVDASGVIPFAQIRVEDEDKKRIQVHYVQPELLNSIEFETTGQR